MSNINTIPEGSDPFDGALSKHTGWQERECARQMAAAFTSPSRLGLAEGVLRALEDLNGDVMDSVTGADLEADYIPRDNIHETLQYHRQYLWDLGERMVAQPGSEGLDNELARAGYYLLPPVDRLCLTYSGDATSPYKNGMCCITCEGLNRANAAYWFLTLTEHLGDWQAQDHPVCLDCARRALPEATDTFVAWCDTDPELAMFGIGQEKVAAVVDATEWSPRLVEKPGEDRDIFGMPHAVSDGTTRRAGYILLAKFADVLHGLGIELPTEVDA